MNINKKHTLIILDWDDTLFPTSWFNENKYNINDSTNIKTIKYFKKLDDELYSFLNKLLKFGEVVIVTNAVTEWVHISSVVLPSTSKLLKSMKVYSARKKYQHKYINNPMKWKELTFKEIITEKYNNKSKFANIISIGDAEFEYNALINLIYHDHSVAKLLKSVKFVKNPTNHILLEQISTINSAFHVISTKESHLDLLIELRK